MIQIPMPGMDGEPALQPSKPVIAVAINGNKNSKYVIRWALEKFVTEGNVIFKLLHVRPILTVVPTPMGNLISISQVREDVVAAYRKDVEWQIHEKISPYAKMLARSKAQVEVLMIESDDVADAIATEITRGCIKDLVIGATSYSMFSRKQNLSLRISECTPRYCTVYVVSKGKLLSLRPPDSETKTSIAENNAESIHSLNNRSDNIMSNVSSSSSNSHSSDQDSFTPYPHSPTFTLPRSSELPKLRRSPLHSNENSSETRHSRGRPLDIREGEDIVSFCPNNSENELKASQGSSWSSLTADGKSWISSQASSSDVPSDFASKSQDDVTFELEKLRIELRHFQGMFAMAQNERIDESQKLNELNKRRLEDANKLMELNQQVEKAKQLAREEKDKYEAAKKEAEDIKKQAKREAAERKEAEMKALRDAREKQRIENSHAGAVQQYLMFTWEEIVVATLSFSEHLIIGRGANGTVYKSTLHSTTAAVKVLHSNEGRGTKQFYRELEILSKVRHPHLLLLLGACPERGCIVYEYMENGSLAARLQCENNTQPIPWHVRFRIAWEIASALVFLHNTKPKPIIHRDLKPENILLDHNFVSKIGDVGLSTMLHKDPSRMMSFMCTGPVGTLSYIDPEYQRTGIIAPKSDVYAFGMVVLQLLTGMQAMALAHTVEMAIHDGNLNEILDPKAGNWPMEETKGLAMLGLSCVELRRADRPDLETQVLPKLEKLRDAAREVHNIATSNQLATPDHFICPILQEVMDEPCVAADGYTYDRKAIEEWLDENDTSPMTNLPLPHKTLLPNFTLLSAITEWKARK